MDNNLDKGGSSDVDLFKSKFGSDVDLNEDGENGSVAENVYDAFARFVRVEVANGNATDDTVAAYYREVAKWVKWCKDRSVDPETAQQYHVEAFREELKRRGMSIATRAHKLSIIRRFYESAILAELREDNPAGRVWAGKDPTDPEEKIKALSEEALGALIGSLPTQGLSGLRDRAIVALMAVHGLRRVEIHRLDHQSVQGDLSSSEPGFLLVDGKAHKFRRVYLRPDTWSAVVTYLQAKLNAGYEVEGAVFVVHGNNRRGCRLSRVSLNAIVDKYLSASHLKQAGVSCHALRHTFGTLAVASGAKIEHLRDAMGHANLETTGIYIKAVERAKNNPAFFINVDLNREDP